MEGNESAAAIVAASCLVVFLLVLAFLCWMVDRELRWMEVRTREDLKGKK